MRIIHNVLLALAVVSLCGKITAAQSASSDYAAELNPAQAMLAAGNYQQAFKEYQHYAKQNNPLAIFTLGLFYHNGWGRPVDLRKACKHYERAAEKNIIAAQHFLADCLINGTHNDPNPGRAAAWYLKAAEAGHLISYCSLAKLYIQGLGVEKNPARGLHYCRLAAEQNIPAAQLQMGFFMRQETPLKDLQHAINWFGKAAQNGVPEASYELGNIHKNHYSDNNKALYWFEDAASKGYLPAYYPTAELYFHATPSEITGKPQPTNLAKSYLWLTAAKKRLDDATQLAAIDTMLKKTIELMPASWIPDLNKTIKEHLDTYHDK